MENKNIKLYSNICVNDIDCKNKKCYKLHNERKRLNICKFDTFFVPYKDEGCHFEDCTHNHPKRNAFNIEKEKDFDNLVLSVVNHLKLDDDENVIEDWKILMHNLNGNDFETLYKELYSYCVNINKLSYELQNLPFYQPENYVYCVRNILYNIEINYNKFKNKFTNMILRYDENKENYVLLYNKLQEDMDYIKMYKNNAQIMLYQNYGTEIYF